MLVAAPLSIPRIAKMKRNVLAYLSQQVFVEEKKTLDLLQGLLICIAWSHTCQLSDEQVTNLTHLATGYAHNLGITKSLPRKVECSGVVKERLNTTNVVTTEGTHSLDEQRTFLGCFCVLSVTSFQASRRNPLGGPYVEKARDALSNISTSRSDLLLDRLVRMIQMGEQLLRGFGEHHERDQARSYAFLLEGSGRRFRTELDRVTEITAHSDLSDHWPLFQLYHQYLIVRLYEPAVTVAYRPEEGVGPSMYRSLCLRNCLGAAKDFLDLLLAQPTDAPMRRSIVTADQAAFVMFMAARLLLIDTPDWDVALARQTLNLQATLDRILAHVIGAERLRASAVEEFSAETGDTVADEERTAESGLTQTARRTRWLREWYEARLQGRPMDEGWPANGSGMGEAERDAGDARGAPSWFGGLWGWSMEL
ncbi:hypothetical protein AK830_g9554 [Neonectria ditissima]|uniref:Transcription factor domain-containing protein n=1 Tax=Neonectria ditissima TaxID=78410 RepID=A0A0P7B8W8_9HYPO|nr:hypothetical protein AK830_g9554 [Neonectria ditissima]